MFRSVLHDLTHQGSSNTRRCPCDPDRLADKGSGSRHPLSVQQIVKEQRWTRIQIVPHKGHEKRQTNDPPFQFCSCRRNHGKHEIQLKRYALQAGPAPSFSA